MSRVKVKTKDEIIEILEKSEFEEKTEQSLEILKKQSCPCCGCYIFSNKQIPNEGSVLLKSICRQKESHIGHNIRQSFLPKGAVHCIVLVDNKEYVFYNNSGRNEGELVYD